MVNPEKWSNHKSAKNVTSWWFTICIHLDPFGTLLWERDNIEFHDWTLHMNNGYIFYSYFWHTKWQPDSSSCNMDIVIGHCKMNSQGVAISGWILVKSAYTIMNVHHASGVHYSICCMPNSQVVISKCCMSCIFKWLWLIISGFVFTPFSGWLCIWAFSWGLKLCKFPVTPRKINVTRSTCFAFSILFFFVGVVIIHG